MKDALHAMRTLQARVVELEGQLEKARAGKPSGELGIVAGVQRADASRKRPDTALAQENLAKAHEQMRKERKQ
jgi:hypothetical protein